MGKEFFVVCIALFLLVFGTYISGTLLVPFAKTLGGTSISIGIIYSCMYAVRLLLGTPIGRISQKRGAKTILTYSLILYPFIAVAYWISWDIPSLIAARLLHGIASAMLLPMAMAYIGEISPVGQEGCFMGVYNTILFFASASGPLVGGLIYNKYGIRHAFLTLFILALSSLIIILAFTKNNFNKTSNNIVIGITQVPLGRFVDRYNKLKLMVASGLITSVLVSFLPLIKSILGIAVLIAVLGAFIALNLAASTALSAILGKEAGMGKTMGFLGSTNSAGTIVGYLALGWIADIFGINNTFYLTGIVFLMGILLFYVLWVT